ncbi:MAG: dephospho-CoA kinase [Thermodesulfobacteriota bacterium]
MLRVGLTGGIACGKSLVAGFFTARGVPVVNDDDAARDAVAKGSDGLAAVVREFGDEVLLPDGALDRPKLGRIVFADDVLRRRLMGITFPFIGRLLEQRFAAAEASGAPMVVYESALLIENGGHEAWRPIVVVRVDEAQQLERLRARNGLTHEEAVARIASQMPIARKAELADYVIDNSGTPAESERRFTRVYAELEARARGRVAQP